MFVQIFRNFSTNIAKNSKFTGHFQLNPINFSMCINFCLRASAAGRAATPSSVSQSGATAFSPGLSLDTKSQFDTLLVSWWCLVERRIVTYGQLVDVGAVCNIKRRWIKREVRNFLKSDI